MDNLQNVVEYILSRTTPDPGQTESNYKMFEEILRYMGLTEIDILESINYSYLYRECVLDESDKIHQRVAYLQLVCYTEIPLLLPNHPLEHVEEKRAYAEFWFRKFSERIDPSNKFYIH